MRRRIGIVRTIRRDDVIEINGQIVRVVEPPIFMGPIGIMLITPEPLAEALSLRPAMLCVHPEGRVRFLGRRGD